MKNILLNILGENDIKSKLTNGAIDKIKRKLIKIAVVLLVVLIIGGGFAIGITHRVVSNIISYAKEEIHEIKLQEISMDKSIEDIIKNY